MKTSFTEFVKHYPLAKGIVVGVVFGFLGMQIARDIKLSKPKLPPISKPENWTWGGTNFLNFTNMLVWGTNISITATNSTNILLQSK